MDSTAALIEHFDQEAQYAASRLVDQSRHIERRMSELAERVEAGRHVNGLGELQSAGTMLDAACATYEAKRDALMAARAFLEAIPEPRRNRALVERGPA